MKEQPIGWTVQFKINPGKAPAFRKVLEEAVPAMDKAEPWHSMFHWFFSPDEKTCHAHVWCAGQERAIAHITGIGPQKYLPRLLELASIERFDVFGTPNKKLAKILDAFPVSSRNPHVAGFDRLPATTATVHSA